MQILNYAVKKKENYIKKSIVYLILPILLTSVIISFPAVYPTPVYAQSESDLEWEWRNPLPQDSTLRGVTWSGSQYVVVGSDSDILTSSMGSELELVHIYAAYWAGDENLPHWIPDAFIPQNGFVVYIEEWLEDQDYQQLRTFLDNLPQESWYITLKAEGYEDVQARLNGRNFSQNPQGFVAQLLPGEIDKMVEGIPYELETVKACDTYYFVVRNGVTLTAHEIIINTVKVEADPERGFYWDYYLHIPSSVADNPLVYLMVGPNNTGIGSDDLQVHDNAAHQMASSSWKSFIAKEIGTPLLVPVFPRPYTEWWYYTHALNRATMMIDDGPLERIDLQLIAMIEDAKDRLLNEGIEVEDKIFMNGFSACGTFSNRFTIMHPHLVRAVASGGINAIPTFPTVERNNYTLRYPVGIADIDVITGINFNYDEYIKVAQYIYMGSEDDNDATLYNDSFERDDAELIWDLVGLDMGERWNNSKQIYDDLGILAQFVTYEGVGHELNGEIIHDVIAFFEANSEPLPSSDSNLLALTVNPGTLTPAFEPDIISYTAAVNHDVASLDLTATMADDNATIEIDGYPATSGVPETVSLNEVGTPTIIDIVVNAEDGETQKTYTLTVNRATFSDIPPGYGFYPYIEAIYKAGITTGFSDGTYRPNDPVSRGQMAAFIARALELDISNPPAEPSFPDVPSGYGFYAYIEAVYAAGITTGYGDGTYKPNDPVNRGQMAAFLARALGLDISNPPAVSPFSDVSPTFGFYPYIMAIYAEGITTGFSDGTYKPRDPVTRGQMAAFLSRALGLHK